MFDLKPKILQNFSEKPKVLYVADVPNWSFEIKGHQYKRYLPQLDMDIGFINHPNQDMIWQNMSDRKHYDVIWHLHANNLSNQNMFDIIKHNSKGTQVILTQNEVTPYEEIKYNIKKYSLFNFISVNNPWVYENFKKAGFDNIFTTFDGVDLAVFGHDTPIEKRNFKVLFVSSKSRLEHKGFYIWEEIKKSLKYREDIEFVEVISDSFNNKRSQEEMNLLYNQCKILVCLSKSEGGPCTLLESAACGVVPLMTKVGYCEYFKNLFILEREASPFIEKILYLKDNENILNNMSKGISKEILPWSDRLMSQHWGYFVQNSILRQKGLLF